MVALAVLFGGRWMMTPGTIVPSCSIVAMPERVSVSADTTDTVAGVFWTDAVRFRAVTMISPPVWSAPATGWPD